MARPSWSLRIHDVIWLALFVVIAAIGPVRDAHFIVFLLLLAAVQVAEPRVPVLSTRQGSVFANLLKLGLGYLIIFHSPGPIGGGIASSYYWILLIPVVSAATTLGVGGTIAFTVLACATYLSFLLLLDWELYSIPADQVPELILKLMAFAIVGFLAQRLADANRLEARRAQAAADQLAEANRNLQEAEEAVRRSERLAALGQMSAGLAHELRNPLGTIRASAEMLRKNLPAGNEVTAEMAGFIASEVDRVNSLVTRFLDFARPLELRAQAADLAEVIDRAVAQVERDKPGQVTIYKNYSPDLAPFPFDADLIERVVYNLLLNAAQATPIGGAVTVKTRRSNADAEISIIDRGVGIDSKHLENIFNPFFSTREHGVGLGLALVAKFVDLHGGTIAVESEPGKGSVFRVFLPCQ